MIRTARGLIVGGGLVIVLQFFLPTYPQSGLSALLYRFQPGHLAFLIVPAFGLTLALAALLSSAPVVLRWVLCVMTSVLAVVGFLPLLFARHIHWEFIVWILLFGCCVAVAFRSFVRADTRRTSALSARMWILAGMAVAYLPWPIMFLTMSNRLSWGNLVGLGGAIIVAVGGWLGGRSAPRVNHERLPVDPHAKNLRRFNRRRPL